MNIETLLYKEIEAEFDVLKDVDMDAKHYPQCIEGVTNLLDRAIELEKLHIEQEKIDNEKEISIQQMNEEKKSKAIDRTVTAATTAATFTAFIWATIYTFANEKEVPVTTIIGRGVIQKVTNLFKFK